MSCDLKIENSSFIRTNTEQSSSNYCPDEIIIDIFMRCICIEGNVQGAKAFSLTNHHIHEVIMQHMSHLDLRVVCPKLTILDAKALGCTVDDEPPITCNMKYQVMKCYQNMARYVEGDLGLTLLTMLKGCSVCSLYKEGQALMPRNCHVDRNILTQIGDDKVQKTYRVLITNNVFFGTRARFVGDHNKFMPKEEYEWPMVCEIMAVCIWTHKVFGTFPYSQCDDFEIAATYGLTPMVVNMGGSTYSVLVGHSLEEDQFTFDCLLQPRNHLNRLVGEGGKVNL